MKRFAINLTDALRLMQRWPLIYGALLMPVLSDEHHTMDPARWDSEIALIKPGVDAERWQTIVGLLARGLERQKPHMLIRLYETNERGTAWKSVGNTSKAQAQAGMW